MRIEQKILACLIHNEEFTRKVAPFVASEYFQERLEKVIVHEITTFFSKYNKLPTQDIIKIELGNRKDINDKELAEAHRIVDTLHPDNTNLDWMLQKTEQFCKDRAVYNAILQGIKIIEGKDEKLTPESIPGILSAALAVSFDQHVGHDYINDADSRFDFYHRVEEKVAFDLEMMNKITNGGLSKKSLNVVLAGTGAGKSLFMCHVAASTLMQGLKYPTAAAHSGHFRALIEELKMKRDFTPDLLIIDYLNICSSARMRMGASVNSYTYIKSIAEELRGLAVEYNIPVLTATQTTRGGYDNSDVGLTDTSESFGLPATADLMFALIRSDELDELNQVMIKQLKNRYADLTSFKRFVLGIDKSKMKLYDVEASAQKDIMDSGQDEPVFDKSNFAKRDRNAGNYEGFK